ncbi:MAG: 2-isopropylmalate synthase [Kiritimatiellaeota bacterium]|nr:2-isopropylmalate synthase [Kiritimatiellota bacterium]
MKDETRKIDIFDTTLRDGEQSPGCTMNLHDKLLVVEHLEGLRVDVIEAGFAAASEGDFEAVRKVAAAAKHAAVASLCRALPKDIDRAWEGIRHAARPRIHTFLATSPIHMRFKLKMAPDAVYEQAVKMVRYARNLCGDVEFSLEDASRSERPFIYRVVEGVVAAGARTVNIPDTVGYAVPEEFARLIADIRANVDMRGARLAVHCHNDLGLAVANSLAAVRAGADQVECTLNGIGERAGNAALEEVVMALATRREAYGVRTGIDATRIYAASRCVVQVTGNRVQANKAVVGENAFAHEAGIHQHGVLANPLTYEIMTPESVGVPKNRMVLGKHSGRHAFEARLRELGLFSFTPVQAQELFARFKGLADRKKTVSDTDIEALARDVQSPVVERVKLTSFNVLASNAVTPMSTVRLAVDGKVMEQAATGDGPINASLAAINKMLRCRDVTLETFKLNATTGGTDALGEVDVSVRKGNRVVRGHGSSTDIIEASILAYLHALNALMGEGEKR